MVLAGGAAESSSLHQIKLVSPLEDIDDWDPDREVRQCDLGLRVRVCCVCVCACVYEYVSVCVRVCTRVACVYVLCV
jgi:hypothetical protein